MSLSTQIVPMVKIIARVDNSFGEWAVIRFEESSGHVSIVSDFGSWSYGWPPRHRGPVSLGRFLAVINIGYMGGKMLGADIDVPDPVATEKSVKETIIEWRNDGSFTAEQAREEWDLADEIASSGIEYWLHQTSLHDAWEMPCTCMNNSWQMFWERLWEPLIRPELAKWPAKKEEAEAFEAKLGESQ